MTMTTLRNPKTRPIPGFQREKLRPASNWRATTSAACDADAGRCLRLEGRVVTRNVCYWIALPTCEKTLLAFEPISRTVPTTITRITASITEYSAMSCPSSSAQRLRYEYFTGSSVKPTPEPSRAGPFRARSAGLGPIPNPLCPAIALAVRSETPSCPASS